jgi:hypothetical protein
MSKIKLPFPHNGQIKVRENARRFNWLSAGRRWRKTTLMMTLAVETVVAGKTFLWGAPTFDQVRIGWNETRKAAGGVFSFKQTTMTAVFDATGGKIIYRSMDNPDNARGHTADRVGFDEIADIDPTAYYEVVRAMLIDTGGDFWGMGTPKGRNWFWREHRAALDRDDSVSWQVPTLGCEIVDGLLIRKPHLMENPDIPFSEIEHLYNTLPQDVFKQEILAEFIENEGSVFRNLLACLNAPNAEPHDHEGHRIIAGVDWGKQQDYTTISAGCIDCRREVVRDRFNKIDYSFQRGRLRALHDKWKFAAILAESNSMGEPIIEQLQLENLPVQSFQTTASTKPPLIENLALAFERAEWQFQNDPTWTSELEAYERKVSPTTGRSQYSAPEGMHDDTVMARALMVWQATNGPLIEIRPDPFANW